MLKTNSHTGRGRAALALALASLALGGCDSDTTGPDPQVPVAAVEMTPEEMDKLIGRQGEVQEVLDRLNAWDLDSRLDLRLPV